MNDVKTYSLLCNYKVFRRFNLIYLFFTKIQQVISKDEETTEKSADFIDREEYREIFNDLDKLKIKDGKIILNED